MTYWGHIGDSKEHLDGILVCVVSLCDGPSQDLDDITCGRTAVYGTVWQETAAPHAMLCLGKASEGFLCEESVEVELD